MPLHTETAPHNGAVSPCQGTDDEAMPQVPGDQAPRCVPPGSPIREPTTELVSRACKHDRDARNSFGEKAVDRATTRPVGIDAGALRLTLAMSPVHLLAAH
jgi:hypothetical protein